MSVERVLEFGWWDVVAVLAPAPAAVLMRLIAVKALGRWVTKRSGGPGGRGSLAADMALGGRVVALGLQGRSELDSDAKEAA